MNGFRKTWWFFFIALSMCGSVNMSFGTGVPPVLNYQGSLADSSGNPLTGQHDMTFSLYSELLGGTAFWQESQSVFLETGGHFSVTLGSNTPIDKDDFNGQTFIGIQLGTDPELVPRQQLTSVAYALKAEGANPIGTILEYAGSSAPNGYLLCQGGEVSRTTYSALFAIIGITYGAGDGSTTFNLPDKRNRTSFGAGDTYALGDEFGSATVNLSHTHTGPNHSHSFTHEHYVSRVNNGTAWSENGGGLESGGDFAGLTMSGSQNPTTTGSGGTGNTGSSGNGSQSVINPGLALNFIIKH